jgi:tetratricopeptide (TPR) repeat protein/transcriptional regulator with XRE-family HTH domain
MFEMDADIATARLRRGWSQTMLAEALGTTTSMIAAWEEGTARPSPFFSQALRALFSQDNREEERARGENTAFLLLSNTAPLPSMYREQETDSLLVDPSWMGQRTFDPFLPHPPRGANSLIGREELLQMLQQQVLRQRNLVLYGLPGAGKTVLAVALAHQPEIQAHFHDGILWAGLGVNPHISGILRRWSNMLNIPLPHDKTTIDQEEWREIFQSNLGQRRLLIVLDDAWQSDAVEALQVGGTECTYVLTTRFSRMARHLNSSEAVRIPELTDKDGVKLLTRFVPEVLQQEGEIARELVHAVGGLPLALALMSKYLGSSAAMHQPRRLQTALSHLRNAERRLRLHVPQPMLEVLSAVPPGAKLSIESVIAVSDYHLPEAARTALRALAILPARPELLSREAALFVADTSEDVLAILCDAGLLEQQSGDYYALHILIADYARTLGPNEDAPLRLIRYGARFIEEHHNDSAALEHESAILLAALDNAWKLQQDALLIRCSHLLIPGLFRWGWYTAAEELLQRTLSAVERSGQIADRVQTLEHLSTLAYLQGNYTRARTYSDEGLLLARQQQDRERIVGLLTIQGDIAHELGDYAQAERFYQEGLLLAHRHNKREQMSALLRSLGVLAKNRGNYIKAREYYLQGLELAHQLDQRDQISRLLINLGVIATALGEYPQAEEYYQQGLELAQQLGHREHICVLYANLGVLADARGDYARAEKFLREGLDLAREMGHRERISLLLLNLGVVINRRGNDVQARAFLNEGLDLAREMGHRERISLFLLNLGDVFMEQEHQEQALAYYSEGLALARQLGHQERISDFLLHLGTAALEQGQLAQAKKYLQEGLTLARQLESPQLICRLLAAWGELYLQQGDFAQAQDFFQKMLADTPTGNRILTAHAQYGLACIAANQGEREKARTLAEQSYRTFEALGHRKKSLVGELLLRLLYPPTDPA